MRRRLAAWSICFAARRASPKCWPATERKKYAIDHERAGDVVLISTPNSWQAYYYWLDDAKAPKFARTVDIHNKPGYDPVELHFDFATKSIPLDATLIKGSHGAPAASEAQRGVLLSSQRGMFRRAADGGYGCVRSGAAAVWDLIMLEELPYAEDCAGGRRCSLGADGMRRFRRRRRRRKLRVSPTAEKPPEGRASKDATSQPQQAGAKLAPEARQRVVLAVAGENRGRGTDPSAGDRGGDGEGD